MIGITKGQLDLLAPNARADYLASFETADLVLAHHGINANARRLSHFMAQVLHESAGLTLRVENMNYRAERLLQVWPSRFADLAAAQPFAHNPDALADKVYGGRMGNIDPQDGAKYIGRGLLQITGRAAYHRIGARLDMPLEEEPALALSPAWALKIAAEVWDLAGCNPPADADSLRRVTRAINGGQVGLASRADWLAKTRHVWPTEGS